MIELYKKLFQKTMYYSAKAFHRFVLAVNVLATLPGDLNGQREQQRFFYHALLLA
jgi:hypothetical protein